MASTEVGWRAGASQLGASSSAIFGRPVETAAWLLALPFAALAALVWGGTLAGAGWLGARRRMRREGLAGLGEAFAPRLARAQYEGGVWRGLWRAHTLSLAFCLVQLLPMAFVLVPAAVAFRLLEPASRQLPPTAALAVSLGVPALLALWGLTVVGGQTMLAWRLLEEHGPRHTTGSIFAVTAAAWRTALAELRALVTLGAAFALAAAAAFGVHAGSLWLAGKLDLGPAGGELVGRFTGFVLAIVLFGIVAEALATWAENARPDAVDDAAAFSFSAWLAAWVKSAVAWFAARGLVTVGAATCLVVGLVVALLSIASGRVFTSGIALGWFAVSAAVLVALSVRRSS